MSETNVGASHAEDRRGSAELPTLDEVLRLVDDFGETSFRFGEIPFGDPDLDEHSRANDEACAALQNAIRAIYAAAEQGRADSQRLDFLQAHGKEYALPEYRTTVNGTTYWMPYGVRRIEDGKPLRCATLRDAVDMIRARGNAGEVLAASATDSPALPTPRKEV